MEELNGLRDDFNSRLPGLWTDADFDLRTQLEKEGNGLTQSAGNAVAVKLTAAA